MLNVPSSVCVKGEASSSHPFLVGQMEKIAPDLPTAGTLQVKSILSFLFDVLELSLRFKMTPHQDI